MLPRHDDHGAAPLRRIAKAAAEHRIFRCDARLQTGRGLAVGHVLHGFGEQLAHVKFVTQRRAVQVVLLQPAESLRCGQSVRMLIRLFRCAQRMSVRVRLNKSLEQEKFPAIGVALWMTAPDIESTTGSENEPGAAVSTTCR